MQQLASNSAAGPLPDNHQAVTLYRNGFTVGDGPFRPLSDPLNKKFVDEMASGRCPAELQEGRSDAVHVAVHDKRGEDYKEATAPAAPAYVAFSGEGQTLSSGSSSAVAAAPVQADQASITVDPSKPKAKVQIRFHDGQKKAQEFNEDHTVGDLRNFCQAAVGDQAMTIMGGFPPKPITDDSLTLKDAGLLGSAVTARPA
uniref:NSFL1 cofactor p47 n=1 Tax=Strombidinopsis acuminata TaxID=141414 RepID=A0A7S3TU47_9SPIT